MSSAAPSARAGSSPCATGDGHHGVAYKLFDKPVITSNDVAEHLEQSTLERAHVLGVEALSEGRKPRDVSEEHGDLPSVRVRAHCIMRP
jgi:hypothetical protein